ncbi:MAG TPA: helix-turn-helix domain-containing protein [Pseudonocardiaceae bacterium]|jgi:AcrR family transcriptional regulator|nr:helix-turn-helix domain-containing protein [Pseudonocardiaceae bacterium]
MTEPTPEKPLRADARRNRARILEVAQQVFAAEGLAAPIDAIATRAGVGVGTIYRHFPTKEALFSAILAHRVDVITEEINGLLDAADPGAAFFGLFRRLIETGLGNKDLFDAMASTTNTELTATSTERSGAMLTELGKLLARAQEAGAVRADVSVTDVKGLLVGAHAMHRHHEGDSRATAQMITIIEDGLRPPAG